MENLNEQPGPLLHQCSSDTLPLRLSAEPLVLSPHLPIALGAVASAYLLPSFIKLRDVTRAGCRDK